MRAHSSALLDADHYAVQQNWDLRCLRNGVLQCLRELDSMLREVQAHQIGNLGNGDLRRSHWDRLDLESWRDEDERLSNLLDFLN